MWVVFLLVFIYIVIKVVYGSFVLVVGFVMMGVFVGVFVGLVVLIWYWKKWKFYFDKMVNE